MARKVEWTVRVVNHGGDGPREDPDPNRLRGLWVEQLRYMGYAKELASFEDPRRQVLEFYAPKGLDSKAWAEQNAARMRSFGIDAAATPKWDSIDERDALGTRLGPTNLQSHMTRHNRP